MAPNYANFICREDGKDSMKFYTDPTYFFELWCLEMKKDTEAQKKELRQKRKNKVGMILSTENTPRTKHSMNL